MDIAVLDAIQQHLRTPLLDQIMLLATHLGDLALVWLVAGAVLVAQPRYRRWGVAVLLAVVATAILGMFVLKPLFGRARPFVAYEFAGLLIPPPSGDSFPSNHSMVSFAAAAALCCLPGKGRGVLALKVSAVAVACLIAFSRLYLYVHYPPISWRAPSSASRSASVRFGSWRRPGPNRRQTESVAEEASPVASL